MDCVALLFHLCHDSGYLKSMASLCCHFTAPKSTRELVLHMLLPSASPRCLDNVRSLFPSAATPTNVRGGGGDMVPFLQSHKPSTKDASPESAA